MAHLGGRPPKYGDEILEKSLYYLDNYKVMNDKVPSNAGLADYLGVSRSTVQLWGTEEGKEEFSDILCKIQSRQERELTSNGLSGDFNSTITKLMLVKHGYCDKTATELTGAGGGPVDMKWTVEIIDKKGEE